VAVEGVQADGTTSWLGWERRSVMAIVGGLGNCATSLGLRPDLLIRVKVQHATGARGSTGAINCDSGI